MALGPLRIVLLALLAVITLLISITKLSTCSPRTNTTIQTVFELTHPKPVTYDFQSMSPHIVVTIPPDSTWSSDEHFHETAETCASLLILSGGWWLTGQNAGTTNCYAGFQKTQRPLLYLKWMKIHSEESASLRLTAPVPFYHTLCSVSQDAPIFFKLCTTPLWLRSLYSGTYVIPFVGARIREWMINTALWYQLRVVYEVNDFWTYEGEIPFASRFPFASDEAWRRQIRSRYVLSKKVVRFASWVGRWMLGMKDSYGEYDLQEDQPGQTFKVQGI